MALMMTIVFVAGEIVNEGDYDGCSMLVVVNILLFSWLVTQIRG